MISEVIHGLTAPGSGSGLLSTGKITELGCACFIDDLPEFLSDAAFPEGVQRIAFDPHHEAEPSSLYRRAHSWTEIARLVAELAETSSESGR